MMTSEDSNMAANAICFAADGIKQEYFFTLSCYQRPSSIFKPSVYPDGNMWCALYGEDLQMGIAGFGETPAKAIEAFDHNWNNQKLPDPKNDCAVCGEDHKGAVPFTCANGDGQ
jgi:hypothetical protein